jgi:NADPH:quinone reductase-like Zn-dependent oxidoreductase
LRPGDEVFGVARGSLAEYAPAAERGLIAKPPQLSFEQAATIGVAAFTALQGLRDAAGVRPGRRVVIYGAGGGVGTFAVQIAKALGAHVTAVTSTRNVEIVRPLHPDELVDYEQEDLTRRGARYDVVFDVAATRSIGELRRLLVPGGILVLAGADKRGWTALLTRLLGSQFRSRVLRQRVTGLLARTTYADLVVLKELVEAGKLCPVIDRQYAFDDAPEAISYMHSGRPRAKVVVNVS